MKNNKQIIIDAPEGKVIDMEHFNQTGNVRFVDEKPEKIEFPKEWSLQKNEYYYITSYSNIRCFDVLDPSICSSTNSLPSKTLAEQMLIFTQLITMRERYREIEKLNNPELGDIDWYSDNERKYCIVLANNKLSPGFYYAISRTFSFQLPSTRDEFLKNFGDMILQCKDILG